MGSTHQYDPRKVYRSLNPHPALAAAATSDSSEQDLAKAQAEHERIYRQLLIQSLLAILLPTEDLENASLRTLVSDVIADLLLGQIVAERVSQAWFLQQNISKIILLLKHRTEVTAPNATDQTDARSRLEKFGLLTFNADAPPHHSPAPHQSKFGLAFWSAVQYAYLAVLFLRYIVVGLSHARHLPLRFSPKRRFRPGISTVPPSLTSEGQLESDVLILPLAPPRPVLTYRSWTAISTFLDLSTRMPWLAGSLALCQHLLTSGAGRLGSPNSFLDR